MQLLSLKRISKLSEYKRYLSDLDKNYSLSLSRISKFMRECVNRASFNLCDRCEILLRIRTELASVVRSDLLVMRKYCYNEGSSGMCFMIGYCIARYVHKNNSSFLTRDSLTIFLKS